MRGSTALRAWRATSALIACVSLLPAASAARAAPLVVHAPESPSGQLAGTGALFVRGDNRGASLRLVDGSGREHKLRRLNRILYGRAVEQFEYEASASRIVAYDLRRRCSVRDVVVHCTPESADLCEQTLAGKPRRFATCRHAHHTALSGAIAVDGDVVAYVDCAHGGEFAGPVVARDLAHPAARSVTLGSARGLEFESVLLAGRYVAASTPPTYEDEGASRADVVVFDRITGAVVYRVSGPYGDVLEDGGIQPDGKLALAYEFAAPRYGDDDCPGPLRLAWFSPQEPFAHDLPVRPCAPVARIADDLIAYEARVGPDLQQLMVTDLHGNDPLPASPVSEAGLSSDFDAHRVSYSVERCVDSAVVVDDVARIRAHGFFPGSVCTVRIAGVAQWRDGTVHVRLVCPSHCEGEVYLARHGRTRGWGAGADFALRTVRARTVRFAALPGSHRRRGVRRRVDVIALVHQPDGTSRRAVVTRTLRVP